MYLQNETLCASFGDVYIYIYICGAVAKRLERWALDQENLGSNYLAAISKLWQFRSPHIVTVHSAV